MRTTAAAEVQSIFSSLGASLGALGDQLVKNEPERGRSRERLAAIRPKTAIDIFGTAGFSQLVSALGTLPTPKASFALTAPNQGSGVVPDISGGTLIKSYANGSTVNLVTDASRSYVGVLTMIPGNPNLLGKQFFLAKYDNSTGELRALHFQNAKYSGVFDFSQSGKARLATWHTQSRELIQDTERMLTTVSVMAAISHLEQISDSGPTTKSRDSDALQG